VNQVIALQAYESFLRRTGVSGGVRLANATPGALRLVTPRETVDLSLSGYVARIATCSHVEAVEAWGVSWCQSCSTGLVWERGASSAGEREGS
jgi:hypothetical protein